MEILCATMNSHKARELKELFPGWRLVTPLDLGIEFDFEEKGGSFLENSLGKAMALHRLSGRPVIADDSGLCVEALGGEPGIFSARFGSVSGKKLEASERNAFLLEKMKGIKERGCGFVCCMALVLGAERFYIVQETMSGLLLESPVGKGGFGYDPIVYIPELGKSVAELPSGAKNRISHRGKAASRLKALMEGLDPGIWA